MLALCGCNQIFGLPETHERPAVDAAYFDAPLDAPYACPSTGTTPTFLRPLHQVIQQHCTDYMISSSAQVAMALCTTSNYDVVAARGLIDGMLDPVSGFEDASFELQRLRLAPEGDEVIATYYSVAMTRYEFRTYRRQPDESWTRGPDVATEPSYFEFSAPSRRPDRRVLRTAADNHLHELAQDAAGAWSEVASFLPSDLGVSYPGAPRLSADGLRLLMVDSGAVVYTDRPSIDAPFRHAEPLAGVPMVLDPYLTDDCSRIYFSGLDSVFYLQRQ